MPTEMSAVYSPGKETKNEEIEHKRYTVYIIRLYAEIEILTEHIADHCSFSISPDNLLYS